MFSSANRNISARTSSFSVTLWHAMSGCHELWLDTMPIRHHSSLQALDIPPSVRPPLALITGIGFAVDLRGLLGTAAKKL